MRVSRIVADWLTGQIAAADPAVPFAAATDGDAVAPDRVSFIISEYVEPTAPPLHLYDITIEIRTPSASDITSARHATAEEWIDGVLDDPSAYDDLETALEPVGTLHDWFVGKSGGVVRYETSIVTERIVRLAIAHALD